MAKIKHTKNELKSQRIALTRFERFLPMLQLKEQQLQAEIQAIRRQLEETTSAHKKLMDQLQSWVELFSEPVGIEEMLRVEEVRTSESNIAGVTVPIYEDVAFERKEPDLFLTPPWIDSGLDSLEQLVCLKARGVVLEEQRRLIAEELRVTSQRVNLFEKVRIPECREHIRIIRIFLGDEQTAAVARAKIAKGRTVNYEVKDEAA